MEDIDWPSFLQGLGRRIRESEKKVRIASEQSERGYPGYPGATEAEIQEAEVRLGARFPPSYRAFLQASNGWGAMGGACPGKLWSTTEIEWLFVRNQKAIEMWGYDPELSMEEHLEFQSQDPVMYHGPFMRGALEISDWGDACILFLSPEVVTPEGEWECWELASWHPGAARFPSFLNWFKFKSAALHE